MSGVLIALGVVGILSVLLLWLYTTSEPEEPEGVRIEKRGGKWTYFIADGRAMYANVTGYWTRAGAIRAARTELDRLERKDAQR